MAVENSKKRRIMIITGDESIIDQIQHGNHSSLIKSFVIDSTDKVAEKYSLPPSIQTELSAPNAKKAKTGTLTCVVCGASALGYNFDAITCESCKAFFRRNALKNLSTFQCRRLGGCEITVETRRRCSACRLSKCFQSGMKRERLLTAEEKAAKRQKIQQNRELTMKQQSETDSEPTDLFESSLLDELASLDENNLLCLSDFDHLFPPTPTPVEQPLLSSEDIKRVETIQNSYHNRIELAARDGLPWNPSIHATTFLQQINARSVTAVRLLSFFKQIPEFNQLNAEDKVTLVKYNLMPLCILNSTLCYNPETDEVQETASDVPFNTIYLQKIHGEELFTRIKRVFESFACIAQYDQRIIQLALIILILTKGFSTDSDTVEPMLNDGMAVYRAQSYYTDLLWKYMGSVHGFEKATKIFNELIGQFMSWQKIHAQLRMNTERNLATADKTELLPIMKSLLRIT